MLIGIIKTLLEGKRSINIDIKRRLNMIIRLIGRLKIARLIGAISWFNIRGY